MAGTIKEATKKKAVAHSFHKTKNRNTLYSKDKSSAKKLTLQHLMHPDYVLFDWEFFSNQLEFE